MKNNLIIIILLFCSNTYSQDFYEFFEKSMIFTDSTYEIITKGKDKKDSLITTLFLDSSGFTVSNLIKEINGNIVGYSYVMYEYEDSSSGLKAVHWRGDTLVFYELYNGEIGFKFWEKRLNGSIYEMEYGNNGKGIIKEYYPSSKLFKIGVINDTVITFIEYYESGEVYKEYSKTNFVGGGVFIDSYKEFSKAGQLLISGSYLNYSEWYKVYNSSGNYLDRGIKIGKWVYYTNKGKAYKIESYNKGKLEISK